MLKRGSAPFLECSSRGEKRLSAFYARPASLNGRSIEEAYQAAKRFGDGTTGLHWRDAKGKKPVNQPEVHALYRKLWEEYIGENPDLLALIQSASGLSDMFGREGSVCQADILWDIRNKSLAR